MILGPSLSVPQCSVDLYVRVTKDELLGLPLEHHLTEPASACDGVATGYTEWTAIASGRLVSVACFWRAYADGSVLSTDPMDVSTNLMLIDDMGYDAGHKHTGEVLLERLQHMLFSESARTGMRQSQLPATSGGLLQ